MKTKICVFTSTRADYGILSSLVGLLTQDTHFETRLFITGTHLAQEHGFTLNEIEQDGFQAFYRVPLDLHDDALISHMGIMGNATVEFAKALAGNKPDVAVILGDRFEALAFALAANGLGIPLVHLHGGEVTQGALDEAYRHCITKLSHLHFVSNEKYRERVIRMGEAPERVFNVGALGIDNIKKIPLLSKEELASNLGVSFKKELLAVTYHPETSAPEKDAGQVAALFAALELRLKKGQTTLVLTGTNIDHGNEKIQAVMKSFIAEHSADCIFVSSLGMKRYLSLLSCADVVVGNSSSGIIEAPALGTPTVNIGDRQKGREMASSIFNVIGNVIEIESALERGIEYKKLHRDRKLSVYGDGDAGPKMLHVLKNQVFKPYPQKEFFDGLEKINS
ncbi:MAG: UDP-N-acetylglucosamine 2-epimerase [Bdellovibrio sp.]